MLLGLAEFRPGDGAAVGGKAEGLARLLRAGLPVPDTLVLPAGAAASEADLARVLATLPAPIIARSSASCEDRAAGAAPGLFVSVGGVHDRAALAAAIDAVRASLAAPLAAAYLELRGVTGATMAVVLQSELAGVRGTIYTRRPGAPDELLIELADGELAVLDRAGALLVAPAHLAADDAHALARLALAAEAAFAGDAPHGLDVELVLAATPVLVQARPLPPPLATARAFTDEELAFSAGEPDARWRWDAAHNPDPLSPAQAGLVELVEAAHAAPVRQRVVGGWLYTTTTRAPARPELAPARLRAEWDARVLPALEHELATLEATPPPSLAEAGAAFVRFYRHYGELSATRARARRELAAQLGARAAELTPRLLAGVGAVRAPAAASSWDVADPSPPPPPLPAAAHERRHDAAADDARTLAAELVAGLPLAAQEELCATIASARDAAAIGEEDDALFARAQAGVRRALAAYAASWSVALDDVLHVPLAELLGAPAPPLDLAVRAAAGRRERARRAALAPPPLIAAGRELHGEPAADPARLLRGRGAGGRARGPVHRMSESAPAPAGAIVVTATVLPGMAARLTGAAGLVAEHGGLTGHGAALARELGLPCVVDCAGARTLTDGEMVWLDGDAGLVLRVATAGRIR